MEIQSLIHPFICSYSKGVKWKEQILKELPWAWAWPNHFTSLCLICRRIIINKMTSTQKAGPTLITHSFSHSFGKHWHPTHWVGFVNLGSWDTFSCSSIPLPAHILFLKLPSFPPGPSWVMLAPQGKGHQAVGTTSAPRPRLPLTSGLPKLTSPTLSSHSPSWIESLVAYELTATGFLLALGTSPRQAVATNTGSQNTYLWLSW